MTRPLAVSMGDPAGIGPEIVVKAWAERSADLPRFVAIGDPDTYARCVAALSVRAPIAEITDLGEWRSDALCVLPLPLAHVETPGAPDPRNGPQIVEAIRRGVDLSLSGAASGLVTCPIAKSVLYASGFRFPGHTEFIADLAKSAPWERPRGPVMMLAGAQLRVALATIHTPLADVAQRLASADIVRVATIVADALRRDFGVAKPRLALAGLNPHAGEAGAIGREEIDVINPAAAQLRAQGIDATDALPADTMFHAEARAQFDAAIAMYHDQGLIPLKTLHFWDAVNVTLGLPIVRTSPDHGTGFDIAGRGIARADSFIAALRLAHDIARRRAQNGVS